MTEAPFAGAKVALLTGGGVLSLLRDDRPDIPFPAMWDLPGGGREGDEAPEACVLRELREELGVVLKVSDLHWRRSFPYSAGPGITWFFVSRQPDFDLSRVRMGSEGQRWRLMPVAEFLEGGQVVPHLRARLRCYLEEADGR
jgi:8-oxo-dGTP diphosphatase